MNEEYANVLIKGVVTYSRLFEALKGMYEVEDDDSVWEIFNQTDDPIEDVVCALRLLYTAPQPVKMQGGSLKADGNFWYKEETVKQLIRAAGGRVDE